MGRQPHHRLSPSTSTGAGRAGQADAGRGDGASFEDASTPALYALRKQTPEPVFGIIKSVLGFRQFSLRGLEKVRSEWSLVTMAWNMKRNVRPRPRLLKAGRPAPEVQLDRRSNKLNRNAHKLNKAPTSAQSR